MPSYKYFLFSSEQLNQKNEILKKVGKSFESGTVIVNGVRKKFTQLSDKPSIPGFIDSQIVAEGDINSFVYTKPKNITRQGV